jgi:hypothetical protein
MSPAEPNQGQIMFRILAFAGVALIAALFSVAPLLGAFVAGLAVLIFAPEIAASVHEALAVLRAREARIVGAIAGMAAAVSAVFVLGVATAYAAESAAPAASTVTIPWGDWLGQILLALGSVFVVLLSRLLAMAPLVVRTLVTNDVIEKAVDYAIATTRDAARGQTVSIQVSNQLIAAALAWVIANEPKIAKASSDKLRPLIVARLSALGQIPSEATASTLAVSAPATSV